MVAVKSTMLALGTQAPAFELPDTLNENKRRSLDSFACERGLLVMFICNHCPFVKHINGHMPHLMREYQQKGIDVVAISSNDAKQFPQDGPEAMTKEGKQLGYSFPYLFDETQAVAKAYRAACTPDFYLFDRNKRLFYRGQYDSTRPDQGVPATGKDLKYAMDLLLEGRMMPESEQIPSLGCNIKWKQGEAPEYFNQ